jgi:DNA-binding NarL/FixJ family response regulator
MDAAHRRQLQGAYRLDGRRLARRTTLNRESTVVALAPVLERRPSDREIEVLQLVADGFSNREIGDRLSIGAGTVQSHIKNLLDKLRASNRAHAAAIALRERLIA